MTLPRDDYIMSVSSLQILLRRSMMSCPKCGQPLTASQIITEFKKGSIRQEFPAEYMEKSQLEIEKDASRGIKSAQKAKKLLTDGRFNKQSKN